MRPVQEIREVFGITVSLTDTLLSLFDQIDYSLFEQGSGDLSIGKLNGQNIRFTKYLNKNLLLTMGAREFAYQILNLKINIKQELVWWANLTMEN